MSKKYTDDNWRLTYWPIGNISYKEITPELHYWPIKDNSYNENFVMLRFRALEIDTYHPLFKKLLWWMENAQIIRLVKE